MDEYTRNLTDTNLARSRESIERLKGLLTQADAAEAEIIHDMMHAHEVIVTGMLRMKEVAIGLPLANAA